MSVIQAGNTTTTSLIYTGDTTGNLVFTTGGANTVALTLANTQAATFANNVTISGTLTTTGAITQTGNATFSANVSVAGSLTSVNTFGFKNRIINGGMTISQYNGTSSVTPTSNAYVLDRWLANLGAASKYSVQQNQGSVTPPAGFINYLGCTSLAATTVGSGDYYYISQKIEGLNVADLGWGTANAKTVTLSAWVRSSLTGTFGGAINNSGATRSYPFSYTISSANTWTQISVTIPGDTTGTWLTTNGSGIEVCFSLGLGSTYSGTAGTWAATNYRSSTGAVQVVATNGATFYITGVQLEVGSQATSFDSRSYGQELVLCQRYYEKGSFTIRTYSGGGTCGQFFSFSVSKRTGASMTASNTSYAYNCSGLVLSGGYISGFEEYLTTTASFAVISDWAASAEL